MRSRSVLALLAADVDRSRARRAGAGYPRHPPIVVAEGGAHSDPQAAPAKAATD